MRRTLKHGNNDKEHMASLALIIGRLSRSLFFQVDNLCNDENNPFVSLLEFGDVSILSSNITLGMKFSLLTFYFNNLSNHVGFYLQSSIDDLKTSFDICDVDDSGHLKIDLVIGEFFCV